MLNDHDFDSLDLFTLDNTCLEQQECIASEEIPNYQNISRLFQSQTLGYGDLPIIDCDYSLAQLATCGELELLPDFLDSAEYSQQLLQHQSSGLLFDTEPVRALNLTEISSSLGDQILAQYQTLDDMLQAPRPVQEVPPHESMGYQTHLPRLPPYNVEMASSCGNHGTVYAHVHSPQTPAPSEYYSRPATFAPQSHSHSHGHPHLHIHTQSHMTPGNGVGEPPRQSVDSWTSLPSLHSERTSSTGSIIANTPQPIPSPEFRQSSPRWVAPYKQQQQQQVMTTSLWEDENTHVYQFEVNGIILTRRSDNNMINGTKLLNLANLSRGKRDGILKVERPRVVVKNGLMHLKGVWIALHRARRLAEQYDIAELAYPVLSDNPSEFLYSEHHAKSVLRPSSPSKPVTPRPYAQEAPRSGPLQEWCATSMDEMGRRHSFGSPEMGPPPSAPMHTSYGRNCEPYYQKDDPYAPRFYEGPNGTSSPSPVQAPPTVMHDQRSSMDAYGPRAPVPFTAFIDTRQAPPSHHGHSHQCCHHQHYHGLEYPVQYHQQYYAPVSSPAPPPAVHQQYWSQAPTEYSSRPPMQATQPEQHYRVASLPTLSQYQLPSNGNGYSPSTTGPAPAPVYQAQATTPAPVATPEGNGTQVPEQVTGPTSSTTQEATKDVSQDVAERDSVVESPTSETQERPLTQL